MSQPFRAGFLVPGHHQLVSFMRVSSTSGWHQLLRTPQISQPTQAPSRSPLHLPVHTVPFPRNPAAHLHEALPSGSRRQLQWGRVNGIFRETRCSTYDLLPFSPASSPQPMKHSRLSLPTVCGDSLFLPQSHNCQ